MNIRALPVRLSPVLSKIIRKRCLGQAKGLKNHLQRVYWGIEPPFWFAANFCKRTVIR
jgi:hypothetical protein